MTASQFTPWWRRVWFWGLAASATVSVLAFVSQGQWTVASATNAIIVGLYGSLLTACVEVYLAQHASRNNHDQLLMMLRRIADAQSMPPTLADMNGRLRASWQAIDDGKHVHLQIVRDQITDEFVQKIQELADGRVVLERAKKYALQNSGLADVIDLKAIHISELGYWERPRGEQWLRTQESAITMGCLQVTRFFVLRGDEDPDQIRRVIDRQIAVGIDVKVIDLQRLAASDLNEMEPYLVNRGIATDTSGVEFVTARNGEHPGRTFLIEGEQEELSYRTQDVRVAKEGFDLLSFRARPYEARS
ncbi:hypothetical protein [Nonomuraea sp. LPB2021202275-12-8]|uniref:hypothetical protein n=1 Tax=Nonomuraea sp. LPB2021202275-12-8 TaxID=3120159 RepID=UPI00300D90B7